MTQKLWRFGGFAHISALEITSTNSQRMTNQSIIMEPSSKSPPAKLSLIHFYLRSTHRGARVQRHSTPYSEPITHVLQCTYRSRNSNRRNRARGLRSEKTRKNTCRTVCVYIYGARGYRTRRNCWPGANSGSRAGTRREMTILMMMTTMSRRVSNRPWLSTLARVRRYTYI